MVRFTSGGMTIRLSIESFMKIAMTVEEAALKLVDNFDDATNDLEAKSNLVH